MYEKPKVCMRIRVPEQPIVRMRCQTDRIRARFSVKAGGKEPPKYDGTYTVTPSAETQILDTRGKLMQEQVVIGPIPQNYGLITYNGNIITVS